MNFLKNIVQKKSKVLIIGLGYVGWPLYLTIRKKGFKVFGLDTNKNLVNKYKKKNKKLKIYYEYDKINFDEIDIIIIALPTPLKNKSPDLSCLKKAVKLIYPKLSKNTLVVLESTSYPSTTNEILVSKIKKKFTIGKDFYIGYSPEREDPGNKSYNIKNIPKIVAGQTQNCKKLVKKFYSSVCDQIVESSTIENAEMAKLYENIFRVVNISLANETKEICKKINIDFNEVLKLASTKPFGFMPFKPGPGAGGHCIPVDPFYFNWYLRRKKINSNFIAAAEKINSQMTNKITNQIIKFLVKHQISKKEKILFLGLAYKKNIDDLRNSPSLEIFSNLLSKKYNIEYNDNYIKNLLLNKKFYKSKNLSSHKKYKVLILSTDHDYYKNFNFRNTHLIFDLRNFFEKHYKNVIKL